MDRYVDTQNMLEVDEEKEGHGRELGMDERDW